MPLPSGFEIIESPYDKKEKPKNLPEGFELIDNPFRITPSAPKEPESISSRIAGIFSKAPSEKGFASNAALTPQEQAIYETPQEGIASLRPPRVVTPEAPVTGGITYNPSGQVTGMTRDAYIAALAQREKQTPDRSVSDAVLDSGILFSRELLVCRKLMSDYLISLHLAMLEKFLSKLVLNLKNLKQFWIPTCLRHSK